MSGGARPGFVTVVRLLLGTARRRASGRLRRARQLRRLRGGSGWPGPGISLGFALACVVGAILHAIAASGVAMAVVTAERISAESAGRVVVEEWYAGRVEQQEADAAAFPEKRTQITQAEADETHIEAYRLARRYRRDPTAVENQLLSTVREHPAALISLRSLWWQPAVLPDVIALLAVLCWALMLVCRGEGDLDVQRPRYPMWEWLFSHPAPPKAIFLAEMLAPLAANANFLTAALFPGILFWAIYGWRGGVMGLLFAGVPIAIGLACMAKAVEMWIVQRLSPRTRGAVLGAMNTFGFVALWALVMLQRSLNPIVTKLSTWLAPTMHLPWPPVRRLVGLTAAGRYVLPLGLVLCWMIAAALVLLALVLGSFAVREGLLGRPRSAAAPASFAGAKSFGREPLYRKELLWFRRDRAALVQALLLPLTLAALQLLNLRKLLPDIAGAWNRFCGAAVLFGTYFLLILGPRSLASEGSALWIAQSWPLGLERLLKAKARFWTLLGSIVVLIAFALCAWWYPQDIVGIVCLAILWMVFARSLAQKTVTLATVTSPSGETDKPPGWMRWACTLGILTFSIGVLTGQWNLAIAGVVYSIVTAAAMWQTFRYRLPYLFDPWSATMPPPPTLLHAMVGIGAMVESAAVLSAFAGFASREYVATIVAVLYGVCALATAVVVGRFLARRGVPMREVWLWRGASGGPIPWLQQNAAGKARVVGMLVVGALLGAALGAVGHLYIWALHWWPQAARELALAQRKVNEVPHAHIAYGVMAIAVAPIAEEFLFRGLLYRALDREWPAWRAVVGAAAFFAVYHPYLSWPPVAALGALNALLFKRTGRLSVAVSAHMAYNAVILAL